MLANLLLTSAHEDLNVWNTELRPYGLAPMHVPMFEICLDREMCQLAINTQIADPSFLIVTSQYAAAALPLSYYQQFTHIFVIGQTTAAHLPQGAALPIVCPFPTATSESLLTYILTCALPKQVILLQGKNARPYLSQQLAGHGFLVQQYCVYERVPRKTLPDTLLERIQTKMLPYLWFTSRSASEIFWELFPETYRQQCLASCILCVGSPRIAAFWNDYGSVKIASAPTRQALLALLNGA